jgi:hypothetical protein
MSNQDLEDVMRAYDLELKHAAERTTLFRLLTALFLSTTLVLSYLLIESC